MARFFQTADPNFVDDFIFQPNWDMAAMALQKKDADVQEQLDTLSLFDSLPIDYWKEVDSGLAQQVQDDYSRRVDDITKQMQGNLMDTGRNRQLLNQLRRDVQKDFNTGTLSKLQANAEAARKFDQSLSTITDPTLRQAYKTKLVQDYKSRVGEQGAGAELFNPGELLDRRDIIGEWTGSDAFKALEPDLQNVSIERDGGRWLVTEGTQTKELSESKIGRNLAGWIGGQNIGPYAEVMQNYLGEQWLDENGNIRTDSGSFIGNALENLIPSLAYKQTTTSKSLQADPFDLATHQSTLQRNNEIARERREQERLDRANAATPFVSNNIDAAAIARTNQVVRDLNKENVDNFKAKIYQSITGRQPQFDIRTGRTYYPNADGTENKVLKALDKLETVEDLIKFVDGTSSVGKVDNVDNIKRGLLQSQKQIAEALKTGDDYLRRVGLDPAEIKAFNAKHKADFNMWGDEFKYSLNDIEYTNESGQRMRKTSKESNRNMRPSDFVGKKVFNPHTQKEELVTYARIVPNSSEAIWVNPNDLNNNPAIAQIEFFFGTPNTSTEENTGESETGIDLSKLNSTDLEDAPSFRRAVNYSMKDATGAQ